MKGRREEGREEGRGMEGETPLSITLTMTQTTGGLRGEGRE